MTPARWGGEVGEEGGGMRRYRFRGRKRRGRKIHVTKIEMEKKNAGVAVLTPDKTGFKTKAIARRE